MKYLLLLLLSSLQLIAKPIETFYGTLDVEEPILLELIESKPVQRLKKVHQYGISYYTSHREEYTRYEHSLGVFALLRMKGASLDEQIAGLLHDVSHTVFSHVGDYIFHHESHQESYQDKIHIWFLNESGLEKILTKYGYTIAQVLSKKPDFLALEQPLPDLCADRLEYNLQGAYHRGYLTKNEINELVEDLQFDGKKWISSRPDLMKKLVQFSIRMSKECWGSAENYLRSSWFSQILHRALELGILTKEDLHFGVDEEVWTKIRAIKDEIIQDLFERIFHPKKYFAICKSKEADVCPKMKFRGIDPWIQRGKRIARITYIDEELANEYDQVQSEMADGWPIKLRSPSLITSGQNYSNL